MKIAEVINYLDFKFQPELQEDYDNSGFLLGDPLQEYSGALVAIDLTPEVISEAVAHGLNLIVTHHPFIYSGIKRITTADLTGQMIYSLIGHHICVYAAHTNLDNLKWGVSGIVAEKLGLKETRILRPAEGRHDPNIGGGIIGLLPASEPAETYIKRIKDLLHVSVLRCSPLCRTTVQRIALCGGSGSFMISDAIRQGADIYLTADLKYHDFQRAEGRIILCDAGHYETEQFAKEIIYSAISKKFSNFVCRISDTRNPYISFI